MIDSSEELSMALFNKEKEIIIRNTELIRKIKCLFYIYKIEDRLKQDRNNILLPLLYIPVFLTGYLLSRFYDPFYSTYKLYKNYRHQNREKLSMAFTSNS
ncbi:MAG: hypothetical protein ABRQ39_13635 [Candidatus Eremiobacterota bacterium]